MRNILLSLIAVMTLSTSSYAGTWDDIKDDLTEIWDDFKEDRESAKVERDRAQADRKKIYEEAEDKTKDFLKDVEDQVN